MAISKSFDTPSMPDRLTIPKGTPINTEKATGGTHLKSQNPKAKPDGSPA